MNLNKCYFRHIVNETEDKIGVSFLLKVENSVRQFNFGLNPSENLETLAERIGTSVQQAIKETNKKKENAQLSKIDVYFFDAQDKPLAQKTLCRDLFNLKEQLKLKIYDQYYEVLFNVPWVVNINLPQNIMTGFPVYPEDLVTNFVDTEKSTFNWYKGENDKEIVLFCHMKWEFVGSGPSYTPCSQDIGKKLKLRCIPGNEALVGPAVEVVSKKAVEVGPGKCPFEARHRHTTKRLSGKSFRFVTYNLLADEYCNTDYARTELYPYCPSCAMHIDYRKQLIVKELLGYNADIVCLQELDSNVFQNYLQPLLDVEGLEGNFYIKDEILAQGLACFYRKDRFGFLGKQRVVLAEILKTETYLQPIWDAVVKNEPLRKRLLDLSTVASATILQSKDNPNEILLVGVTHLYYPPDAEHIRLIQGGIIIYWLRDLRNNLLKENPNKRVSLIICGDFNSEPSCGIYQLYTTGVSPDTFPDWKSNSSEIVSNLTLAHDICLASACGAPPHTVFSIVNAKCIDYIYYDRSGLKVEQVVPFPSLEELRAHTALPSIVFPSDHIAVISDLRFL